MNEIKKEIHESIVNDEKLIEKIVGKVIKKLNNDLNRTINISSLTFPNVKDGKDVQDAILNLPTIAKNAIK